MNRYRIAHDRPAWLSVLLCLALVLSSLLPVRTAQAAATLVISKTLIGSQTAFESGTNFQYRLTWQCAGAISPQDDCYDMKIVDVLPEYIEFVSMDIVPPVTSVTTSGANPQTVTVNFSSPVLAGATGSMEMTVRYRPGVTPNGLTSSNTATVQANTNLGAPITPVISSPPVVTTSIAVDESTASKSVTSGGAVGGNTTYRIRVTPGSGTGFRGVTNLTVSDELPPGATYVSATTPTGGTLVSAPAAGSPGTVTWTWTGTGASSSNIDFTVTVNYPAPPNATSDSKTNTATVGVTLVGGGTKTLTPSVTHNLTTPVGDVVTSTFAKTFIASPLQVGEEASIQLRTRNTGNVVTSFVVEDVIPNELNVVRITTPTNTTAAEYQKNGVSTWIPGVTLGTNVAVNATNFPGLSPVDYVSALRFQMTNVPVNVDRDNLIYATVINPPHGGGPAYTLPRTVPNTATSMQSYGGTSQTEKTSTANLSVIEPRTVVYVAPTKSVVSGSPAVPGGIIRLRLQAAANSGSDNVAMLNPVLTDLLPANLEYAANAVVAKSATASAECLPGPSVQQIANYNSTGRTLLIWSWAGRSPACTIPPGQNVSVDFNTRVLPGTAASTTAYANVGAVIDIDNPSADTITKSCGNGTDPYVPGAIPGSPDSVDSAVLCQTNRTSYSVSSAFVLTSRKGVTGQLNADGNPATDDFLYSGSPNVARTIRGGTMLYSMEISNAGNVNVTSLDVIDILPFGSPSPGNLGVGNPIALGSTWTPLFLTAITAPAGGKVYYSTDTSPCRPLIVAVPGCQTMTTLADGLPQTATGQWSTVLPADPRTVRSLRINFGSYVLTGGGTLRFEWPMSAPSDAPISLAGPDGIPATADDTDVAWNSFGYSAVRSDTGVAFASAPTRVGIIVEQAPAGLASYGNYVWNDVNRNGVQDEPVSYGINGARVDLYRDGDGNPLTTLDQVYVGTQLTAVDGSGNPGYYLFPGLAAGAYFARFYPPSAYPNASPYDQGADTLDSDGQPVSGQSYLHSHFTTLTTGQAYVDTDQGFYGTDWGDLPDPLYNTDSAGTAGPSHVIIPGLYLGGFIDAESDGQPNSTATGDDSNGVPNDEDGVTFPAFVPGQAGMVVVQATNTTSQNATVYGFIDWNGDSSFGGSGETATATVSSGFSGNVNLVFNVPSSANISQALGARFRLSTDSSLGPDGPAADGEVEDYLLRFADYGDLPDTGAGTGIGNYNTTLADNGARHLIDGTTFLGSRVDAETDGQPNATASGDDAAGASDDEDGVIFATPLVAGKTANVVVTVTDPDGTGFVSLFIDFNGDGDFADPGEAVLSDEGYPNGVFGIGVVVPPNATGVMGVRVRLTDNVGEGGASPTGAATSGEVEDYLLATLGNYVWFDANGNGLQDELPTNGVNGVTVNLLDGSGNPVNDANGNPITTVTANDGSGNPGYYEFPGLPAGSYQVEFVKPGGYGFTTPDAGGDTLDSDADVTTGRSPVLTLTPGQNNPTIDAGLIEQALDWGDLPDTTSGTGPGEYQTLLSDNGPRHTIVSGVQLGAVVDAEANGQPNATATGDDTTGTPDDEDGVVFLTPLVPGQTAQVQVTVADPDGTAFVSLFIDWNGDGDFGDAGEVVLSDQAYAAGAHTLALSVPSGVSGDVGVRVRLTDEALQGGASPTGPASSGEVEDYLVRTTQPVSLGSFVWSDTNGDGVQTSGEPGIPGAVVRLLDANSNAALDVFGNAVAPVVTGENGFYNFNNLAAGDNRVEVTPPAGYAPTVSVATPNNNDNTDSNGVPLASGSVVRSGVVTLAPGTEPAGELLAGGGADQPNQGGLADANGNMTVDFGFVPGVAIGNIVWGDTDNSGTLNGSEVGIDGVTVELWSPGANGVPGGGDDTLVRTTTTASGGFYLFIVPPGSYYVAVVSSSAPLAGLNSSTGGAHNPDTQGDHPAASGDDGVPGIVPGKVVSQVFSATVGGQSTSDTGDPADWDAEFDNSSYMTIDFGFTSPPNAVTLRDLQATTLSTGERLMALLRSWLQR